jgi:hypothetical protein
MATTDLRKGSSMDDTAGVPKPAAAGPEMAALARFHRDVSWSGTIEAGGMGPGSPAMTGTGTGVHRPIQDGRWIVGDYRQDQYLADGTFVLTWQLHWVAGWDPIAHEFRAVHADNYGQAGVMRGRIDGELMTFETADDDARVRIRLTWDATDPDLLVWRNEMSVAGAPWSLVEQYDCLPMATAAQEAPQ